MRPPLQALLLVLVAAGCGSQGSDAVFLQALPGRGDSMVKAPRQGVRLPNTRYEGLYRRAGDDATFRPCGTTASLAITGTGEGRALLADRFRWNSVWQNLPLYAVLRGTILTDTLVSKGDSAPTVVRRFFVTGVDSMRAWDGDCGGMSTR
jgi:hypothetical protein